MTYLVLCKEHQKEKYSCLMYNIEADDKLGLWGKAKNKVEYHKMLNCGITIWWSVCPHHDYREDKSSPYPDECTPFKRKGDW